MITRDLPAWPKQFAPVKQRAPRAGDEPGDVAANAIAETSRANRTIRNSQAWYESVASDYAKRSK